MKRGIGIIPERPPVDVAGLTVPGFAFFEREELAGASRTIYNYLADNFPQAFCPTVPSSIEAPELSTHEIGMLTEVAIEETGVQARLQDLGLA